MKRSPRARRCVAASMAGVLLLAAAPPAAGASPPPVTLVEVQSETLIIGPAGTRTRSSDRALLSREKPGLLRVEIDLPYGVHPPREHVSLELRVRLRAPSEVAPLAPGAPPRDPERPVIGLAIDSTARAGADGETVLRSGGGEVDLPGSLLYEAYVSPQTGERIVVHLKVRRWEERDAVPGAVAGRPLPITYRVWIYRQTEGGLDAVAAPLLSSVVGHAAAYEFGFTLGQGEARTRESLRVRLLGVEVRDGILTGSATLEGTLRGSPVRRESGWSLEPGEASAVDLELGSVGGEELGFHVVIIADFAARGAASGERPAPESP